MSEYHEAILAAIPRYREMAKDEGVLTHLLNELEDQCNKSAPICKMNRWLGFVQGVLISRGVTTVNEERDFTRPLFRPLDFLQG